MDETNPKDTTASPAAGSNPAPAAPAGSAQPQPTLQTPAAKEAEIPIADGRGADAKSLHNDMERILQEVKLPERRDFTASGDAARKNREAADVPSLRTMPGIGAAQTGAPENQQARPEIKQKKSESVTPIHTLKDDLQDVVRDKKMSMAHAVALEEEKKRGQKNAGGTAQKEGASKASGIILGMLALLLLAAGAIYGVYAFQQGAAPASSAPEDAPLFFADRTVIFPLGASSGAELKRALAEGLNAPRASLGAIMRIMPVVSETDAGTEGERASTIEEFLVAIGAQTPPELIRAFRGDFLLGIHAATERNAPVLIIPVTSYERAFAGLLAWEAAMSDDLAPFFAPVPALTVDETGLLVNRKFEDSVLQNYDVRILRDDAGEVKLFYSFPTRGMLVIMENPYSFAEVLGRLRAARQL